MTRRLSRSGEEAGPTSVEIVVPTLNEEKALASNVGALHRFLSTSLGDYQWRILIADNGSTDSTPDVAKDLSQEHRNVGYIHLAERGRGRALSKAWLASEADILAYTDVDLSTDLGALTELVEAVDIGGYDIAVASRLARGAQVIDRPRGRELISRAYSRIVRAMFLLRIRDYQCGFKAISRRAAQELVPLVQDTGWFFDSELLILGVKSGYRVKEVPVKWTDDPDSRVKIVGTAYDDLKGLLRLRFGGLSKASRLLADKGSGAASA